MDYAITKDNILLAKCVMYERRENDFLIRKTLTTEEQYRVVLFFRGKVIDFELADDLPLLPVDPNTGEINGRIYSDTYYIEEVTEYSQLTNKELNQVPNLLSEYQQKKLAEINKRLIKFPGEILN